MRRTMIAASGVVLAGAVVGLAVAASMTSGTAKAPARVQDRTTGALSMVVPAAGATIAQYPNQNVSLAPLSTSQRAATSASELAASSVVDDASKGPHPTSADGAGTPLVEFVSYSNSQHGQIQKDGSVSLQYQNIPAYIVTWSLPHEMYGLRQLETVPAPSTAPVNRSCSFVSVVSAQGTVIEAFEDCE